MIIVNYILYLSITCVVVLRVGNLCFHHGKVYISNYFPKHEDLGHRLNTLLRIAYYLLNLGLTVFCLYTIKDLEQPAKMIAQVSEMIGIILLILGVLHFNNILLIFLLHKHLKP